MLYICRACTMPAGIALLLIMPFVTFCQTRNKDSSSIQINKGLPVYPDSITTFDQLDMPVEMALEFSKLQPAQALLFRDEFQQMHDGVYGEAERTIKVWYIDDHIIGYIIERPFDAGSVKLRKSKINIPVTWCCNPSVAGHEQHCVTSLAELRAAQAANKCTGWFVKLPDAYGLNPKPTVHYDRKNTRPAPEVGEFGHAQKTGTLPARKKKGKHGFEQYDTPATDSTTEKQPKDSI